MPDRDPERPFKGWGTALRTAFRPVVGDLFGTDHARDDAMQSIGRMQEAAAHLKSIAEGLAPLEEPAETQTGMIFASIDEATDGAADFH